MHILLPFAGVFALASSIVAQAGGTQPAATSAVDLVVEMSPCKLNRPVDAFYVRSSKTLALKGTVEVDGTSFDIYLPRDKKGAYSVKPRPERKNMLVAMTSTYLSVDQNHDGRIGALESYYSEFPLRIGDVMFDVVQISADGSKITLRRVKHTSANYRLAGSVLGRKAADFEWRDIAGKLVRRDDFAGKVLIIEPPRVSRRLHYLRGWSYGTSEQVLNGAA
jgi:hypothetical protein